jgi:hypothetical protein
MAEYIINSYEGLNETTLVTKNTDSSRIQAIAAREKTDNNTVQQAINQAKQSGKPININESDVLTKFLRKIGWGGDSWTPQDYKKQIRELPDNILKLWYKDPKGIPYTPLEFQQKLVKLEMERRKLLEPNLNETQLNKMKKSQFKQFLKEEIKSTLSPKQPVNEMAAIKGDIKTKVDQIIADNPDMEVGPLARMIMKDPEINSIIDRDNLSDMAQNQTQKYIRLARGERELGQRGRKADPNKPASSPKTPKSQTGPSREELIHDLEHTTLEGDDAKWAGKLDKLSTSALKSIHKNYFSDDVKDSVDIEAETGNTPPSGVSLNENESNDYMRGYGDGYTDGYADGEEGNEKVVTVNESSINEMAKLTGDLADAIGAVIANVGDDLDGLALKKAIKADPDVIAALGSDTLYDNQLNKFISLAKGERELGQRGRKADPNKVSNQKPTDSSKDGNTLNKTKSTPSLKDMVDGDDEEISDTWGKEEDDFKDDFLGDDDNGFSSEDTSSLDKERSSGLKDQETKKFWKSFVSKMREKGEIDASGKPKDKERYEKARAEAKKILDKKLKGLK